jgi:uncharacterized protein
VFTTSHLLLGLVAAAIIGLSKSAVPGGGLLATPLLAMVVSGRLIAGTMLPLLIIADVLAVFWFGRRARRDVLGPLVRWVGVGFAAGTLFYVQVGAGGRTLDIVLGASIVILVGLQLARLIRRSPAVEATPAITGAVGVTGGFTTFVANAAGPVLNTYLVGIGLPKEELIGTSAWFYFAVNVAKIPVYLAIGRWASGGAFFTAESLRFDAVLVPVVLASMLIGRQLLSRIPQQTFTIIVLVLAAVAATKLILGF